MPKLAKVLGAREVSKLVEPDLHFVGTVPGLALQITPAGAKSWTLRAVIAGRRRDMGLGNYPSVTLAMAHEKARQARELIRQGIDPIEQQRAARSALKAIQISAITFKQTAEAYIAAHEAGWRNAKHASQWRGTLEQHVYPVLGDLLVRDVQKEHVLNVLTPIWTTKSETASRVRGRIESVLSYAMQGGYRPEGLNPARWKGGLDKLLAPRSKVQKVEHHAALPYNQVGGFMVTLRASQGMGARALEFAILTAARSGEVRGATWSEINLDERIWVIPESRMKAGREHRVPLSDAAIDLLKQLPRFEGNDLVFPAPRGGQLSDMTLSAVLRKMKLNVTVHGFRSTFRDWTAERTAYPNELCEMALAHTVSDKVESAYRRGDLLQKRIRLMHDWADFCSRVETAGKVVPINRTA